MDSVPRITVAVPGINRTRAVPASVARVDVHLTLQYRSKDLLWFSTYAAEFVGAYTVTNRSPVNEQLRFQFNRPDPNRTYIVVRLSVDDQARTVAIDPARGLDKWRYRPANGRAAVAELDARVHTNFAAVEYLPDPLYPTRAQAQPDSTTSEFEHGRLLRWHASALLTNKNLAMLMPALLNAGLMAARMSFFTPVGLLFFFVLLGSITVLKGIHIHPVHYLFVNAGACAFHLLFTYLVDVLELWPAFGITAAVSVLLVSLYLAAALGARYPRFAGATGQLVHLMLFSYSFFLPGTTRLTVAIGSLLTLAILMLLTARMDWSSVLRCGRAQGWQGYPRLLRNLNSILSCRQIR